MVAEAIVWLDAGRVAYAEALQMQEALWEARLEGKTADHLLVLEHPPVITLGLLGGLEDLRVPQEQLMEHGVEFYTTNRGGKATFHGPGQLVIYPVMKLADRDIHAYLWKLEECILRVLGGWGIAGSRVEEYPGVWVGKEKIAAVGVAVRQDVTLHGLALNVDVDLDYFQLITPCGIRGRGVTSMQAALRLPLSLEAVKADFPPAFAAVFGCPVIPAGQAPKAWRGLQASQTV